MCGMLLNLCYVVNEKYIQEKIHDKFYLKFDLASFNVIVSIFIPFKCPQFLCNYNKPNFVQNI